MFMNVTNPATMEASRVTLNLLHINLSLIKNKRLYMLVVISISYHHFSERVSRTLKHRVLKDYFGSGKRN